MKSDDHRNDEKDDNDGGNLHLNFYLYFNSCMFAYLSTLFMMLSVSAPFLTAQFNKLVTLKALFREMPTVQIK